MKKALVIALAALCLLLAPVVGASAEGFDTPVAIADSYIDLCAAALLENAGIPERYAAFPELLEQICGFLDESAPSARAIGEAAAAMRQAGDEPARQAVELLYGASRQLRSEDIRTPFALADLTAAERYRLLPVADVAQFIRVFGEKAAAGSERFVMACPAAVREQMRQSTSYRAESPMLINVANQCGIRNFNQIYYDDCWLLMYDDINYFPGVRIARAWRDGGVEALSEEERRTLDAALQIANAAAGTELERERQIHDALCERISYYTDSNGSDWKDSAIGALLEGRADCDGYSDAFYLCGTLAGLQVRYMPGDSAEAQASDEGTFPDWLRKPNDEGGHMWNLICLDGKWVTVDVTWDDGDSGISYLNYNLGAERLGLTHLWDGRTLLAELEYGLSNALRDLSLAIAPVGTWDELYGLCRSAAQARPERLYVACPLDSDAEQVIGWMSECLYSTGVSSYSWHTQNAIIELFRLVYKPEFRICDTREEAADYIEACAANGTRDFSIYFTPALAGQMFANEHAGIKALIGASPLAETRYSYNEENRRVIISGAEYHGAGNVAASVDDIRAILRPRLTERQDSAWFVLPDGTDFESVSDSISDIIYSCGARSYSWSLSGGRVTITDIAYYPEFALVGDEDQLVGYLQYCRSEGITGFRAYCGRGLYEAMAADGFSRFFRLLSEAGCQVNGISYDEANAALIVEDAAW